MLKFSGLSSDGRRRVIGIGLSVDNLTRLIQGQPIAFNLQDGMGLRVVDTDGNVLQGEVLIIAGQTEDAIRAELAGTARLLGVEIERIADRIKRSDS